MKVYVDEIFLGYSHVDGSRMYARVRRRYDRAGRKMWGPTSDPDVMLPMYSIEGAPSWVSAVRYPGFPDINPREGDNGFRVSGDWRP